MSKGSFTYCIIWASGVAKGGQNPTPIAQILWYFYYFHQNCNKMTANICDGSTMVGTMVHPQNPLLRLFLAAPLIWAQDTIRTL